MLTVKTFWAMWASNPLVFPSRHPSQKYKSSLRADPAKARTALAFSGRACFFRLS